MSSFSLLFKQYARPLLMAMCIVFFGLTARGQGDAGKGQVLFQGKCTSCHKIDDKLVGPALGPQLVSETDDKFLIKWIQNNQALIAAKNPKAVTIYNEYNQSNMSIFTDLSDGDVTNIIAYVRAQWKTDQAAMAKAVPAGGAQVADSGPSDFVIWALIAVIIIAFVVILVLNRVIGTLERMMVKGKGLMLEEEQLELVQVDRFAMVRKLAKNKKLVFFVLLCSTLAFGSWTWVALWTTNVHQGYQPIQPIRFPHDLHAGAMKISCEYCHSGAYKAKNATIPSLNICMNCHKVVKTENAEIQKDLLRFGLRP